MSLCTSCKFKTRKGKCSKNFLVADTKTNCIGYEATSIDVKYHNSGDKTRIVFWGKVS